MDIAYQNEDGADTTSALAITVDGPLGPDTGLPSMVKRFQGLDGAIIFFSNTSVTSKSYHIQSSVDLVV